MSIKNKTKEEVQKSFFYAKRKPFYPLALVVMLVVLSLLIIPSPLTKVEGYTIISDEAVDADSDIDATANIGDDGATSFVDAQIQDDTDQVITEGQGAGYVAPVDIEDYLDSTTNTQDPADLGTYVPDDTNLYDVDDSDSVLTEENTGGVGVEEYLDVDGFDATTSNWDTMVGSPHLDAEDYSTGYIWEEKSDAATVNWFSFEATSGTGTGLAVNVTFLASAMDTNDGIHVEMRHTGGAAQWVEGTIIFVNAGCSGNAPVTWFSYTIDLTGTFSQAEVDSMEMSLEYQGVGGGDDIFIDHAYLGVSRAGADNYEFDREFSFTSLDTAQTNNYLCIFTGTIGSETLDIDVWEASAWADIGTDIVDANDDTWVNISISTWLDAGSEYFRFQGADEAADTSLSTWGLDGILIHSWTDGVDDYELEWEHQVNVDIDKDGWMLTLYGYSSDATEEFEIQMWDWVGVGWDTALLTHIDENEGWYNISIPSSYVDTTNEWITYRFTDSQKSSDSDQDTLYLDYSGVRAWNMSTYWHEFVLSGTDYNPNDDYVPFTDSPLSFQMEAGATYDVQIKGTDSILTPVGSGYIYFNTVDDSGTATLLTTSYQNYLTSQSAGNNTHTIYLWINMGWTAGDPLIADANNEFVLNVYIVPA